jgi:hypothetical protein
VLLSVDGLREAPGRQDGPADMARLARSLGYAGPRSARRALRRWDNRTGEPGIGR